MKAKLGTGTVFIAALLAAMALGGSFYEALVLYPAWSASPPASFALIQGPNAADSTHFWILVHVTFEAVLLAALALNWRAPQRRTLLLIGLGVHVVMRAWTFVYFVPEILAFVSTPPAGPFSPELAARASLWGALGWIRRALIAATSVLVLLALMTPAAASEPAASRGSRRDQQRVASGCRGAKLLSAGQVADARRAALPALRGSRHLVGRAAGHISPPCRVIAVTNQT